MGPAPTPPNKKFNWGPPTPNWDSPQFPSVGPKEPAGNYRSQINAAPPIDAAQKLNIARVVTPWQVRAGGAIAGPLAGLISGQAGDKSRAAFSRASTDTSSNALRRGADQYNTEYQGQAEKSRAEDILAQRQNTFDRFRMDVMKAIFDEDTRKRFISSKQDISAYYERERKNSEAMVTAALMRMIGGLL